MRVPASDSREPLRRASIEAPTNDVVQRTKMLYIFAVSALEPILNSAPSKWHAISKVFTVVDPSPAGVPRLLLAAGRRLSVR